MKKIIGAGSVSAHYFVHVKQTLRQDVSVSAGLSPEFTHAIPLYTQNMQVILNGTFGSGSASTTLCIDKAASANGPFVNIASISVPMVTAVPVYADEVLRFRHAWSSAAAAITNASVDVWIA
jgi:hypothetical protein